MANLLEILISAKDNASGTVTATMSRLKAASEAYSATMRRLDGEVNATVQSLAKLGLTVLGIQTLRRGFEEGIKVIDEYKLATIGIAATLTDMAAEGTTDLKAFYTNALSYAQDTYDKVELAAAKFFASGREMVQAWQILVQKGVVISSDQDIENLGIITDKIKLATAGQASSLQIAQELRAVLSGQARATDQIAMMLRDQIGPEWEKQLKQAREEGRVLEFIAEKFKGLKYASGDVEKTLEAQKSTLGTLLSQVGRAGLAKAYEDIVGLVSDINDYLRSHKDQVAGDIQAAWERVRTVIFGVRDGIKEISAWSSQHPIASGWLAELAKLGAAILGAAVVLRTFVAVGKTLYALMAANLAYISALFAPIVAWVSSMVAGLIAAGGPIAWITAALSSLIILLAGMTLTRWIGEWEVAGLTIKEYIRLGELYLQNFFAYIRDDFAADVKTTLSDMWDWLWKALVEAIPKAWEELKAFGADALAWVKSGFTETDSQQNTPTGPLSTATPEDDSARAETVKQANQAARDARTAEINYLLALRQYRKTGHYPGASPAAEEGKGRASADTPQTKPPKGEADKPGKGGLNLAKQLAAAELELAKATARAKLALVENEQEEVEAAYREQQFGAEEYYNELRLLNDRAMNAKIEGIDAEIAAVNSGLEKELAAAKQTEQATAARMKADAKLIELQDQKTKARIEAHRNELDLNERERRAIQERASTTARALDAILGQEQISADKRAEIAQRLRVAQMEEIEAEAKEIEQKTEGRVKAEEYAAVKIKAIQKDLRGESLKSLKAMLADEKTSLAERERIWRQIEENIQSGEISTWEALKLGIRRGLDEFKSMAQSVYDAARGLISDLRRGFSDFFSKTFKGEIKSIEDAWNAMCDLMVDAFSKAMSDILADSMIGGIKDLFGGVLGGFFGGGKSFTSAGGATWSSGMNFLEHHRGGVVGETAAPIRRFSPALLAFAPRLHTGLAADEFPAILQRGETVIPRGGLRGQSSTPLNVEVKIDNQSSTPLRLEQGPVTRDLDKIVIGIVARDINEYGVLGKMLATKRS